MAGRTIQFEVSGVGCKQVSLETAMALCGHRCRQGRGGRQAGDCLRAITVGHSGTVDEHGNPTVACDHLIGTNFCHPYTEAAIWVSWVAQNANK